MTDEKTEKNETRSAKIQVSVTPTEKRALEEAAFARSEAGAYMTVSDLVREFIQRCLAQERR